MAHRADAPRAIVAARRRFSHRPALITDQRRGMLRGCRCFIGLLAFVIVVGSLPSFAAPPAAVPPVEFSFVLEQRGDAPFARDVWAEIALPGGVVRSFPAFYDQGRRWRVRVAARAVGEYRLRAVEERAASGRGAPVVWQAEGGDQRSHAGPAVSPSLIRVDPATPRRFVRGESGAIFLPLGINLGWGDDGFHARAFAQLAAAGGNWTRVWMAHWSGQNLDWRKPGTGPVVPPGEIDVEAAERWDRILAAAESSGIAVQVVLQHHGQFSVEVNPEWPNHPWNEAQGGFLACAADFFTDERARRHTRTKLRYIAARYGHSSAVMAWELFNEVNFTDAWRIERREAEVVAWHDEMAAWLRRHDPHGHLVTTSTSEPPPAGPLWRSMDYLQPHLYHVNMLAHVRHFPSVPWPTEKPIFYGEIGDDHMAYGDVADRDSGAGLIPQLWLGLMADRALPAQPWYWYRLLDSPRWAEMAAWMAFVRSISLEERTETVRSFLPRVRSEARVPARLIPGVHWAQRPAATLDVPGDGREPAAWADLPEFVVGEPRLVDEGRADRFTLRLRRDAPGEVRIRLADLGREGGVLELSVAPGAPREEAWMADPVRSPASLRPATFTVSVPAGESTLVLRNRGPGAVRLAGIDLDQTVPALAAVGRRDSRGAFLYVWHREQVHAANPVDAVAGTVEVESLPAGRWRITWWDMTAGRPAAADVVTHRGGRLDLPTPQMVRHAAAILTPE